MLIYLSCIIKAVSHWKPSITLILLKVNGVGHNRGQIIVVLIAFIMAAATQLFNKYIYL